MTPTDSHAAPLPSVLYVYLSDESLCFARYEPRGRTEFLFAPWPTKPHVPLVTNLREAIAGIDFLHELPARIDVLVDTPVTLVPMNDFQEEYCKEMYDFCFTEELSRCVFYDTLPCANAVLLFALNETVCRVLSDVFGDVYYTCVQTHVLRHWAEQSIIPAPGRKMLWAHLHGHEADLAVFDGRRLLMANRYDTQTSNDVAYYVLNVMQHTGMEPATDIVQITGNYELCSQTAALLGEYVKDVRIPDPAKEFHEHIVSTTPDVPYGLMAALAGAC